MTSNEENNNNTEKKIFAGKFNLFNSNYYSKIQQKPLECYYRDDELKKLQEDVNNQNESSSTTSGHTFKGQLDSIKDIFNQLSRSN